MPVNAERSRHALEAQSPIVQRDSDKLPEPKAIEPALAAEAGKAGLASRLHPAEEAPIGLVQALERGALKAHWQSRRLGIVISPFREALGLIEIADGLARLAVSANALFQRRVVELALRFENLLKGAMLRLGGQKPVAKGKDHEAKRTREKAHHVSHVVASRQFRQQARAHRTHIGRHPRSN
jgi:hypothetical protein